MLPAEVEFLLFVSGVPNNAISKDSTVPFACPMCAEQSTGVLVAVEMGCKSTDTVPKHNPEHRHICQHKNKLPMDTDQNEVWFQNGI